MSRRADESAAARADRLSVGYLCRDCGFTARSDRMLEHLETTGHREVGLAPNDRNPAGAGHRA